MQLILKDIMQLKQFRNSKIITKNSDMNRVVDYVDVTEVPDAFNWFRANTLVLSTAYALRNDIEAQVRMVSKLAKLKAAALCIKPQRFIGKIPEAVIEEANKLNFPIIEIPNHVLYSDIILEVSRLIFDKKEKFVEESDINDSFTKILLKGGGFNEIAEELSSLTKNHIIIEDIDFNILSYANASKSSSGKYEFRNDVLFCEGRRKLSIKNKNSKDPILYKKDNNWVYATLPIHFGDKVLGFITMIKGKENNAVNVTILKHAAIATAFELNKTNAYYNQESLIKEQLINTLISSSYNSNKNLNNQITHFGWPINEYYASIAIHPKLKQEALLQHSNCKSTFAQKLIQLLNSSIYHDYDDVITHITAHNILFFIGLSEEEARDYKSYIDRFIENVVGMTSQFITDIHIGISKPYPDIYNLKSCYEDSVSALKISKKIKVEKKVIFYDEFDFYEIILNYEPKEELVKYYKKYINPLIIYQENEPNLDLLHTLRVYLNSGASLVKTAQALYIHRNTLIYRLNKIKEILDYDLDNPEIQFKINFALKVHKCLK